MNGFTPLKGFECGGTILEGNWVGWDSMIQPVTAE